MNEIGGIHVQDYSNRNQQGRRNQSRGRRDSRSTHQPRETYALPTDVIEQGGDALVAAAEDLGRTLKNRGLKNLPN